MEKNVFSFLSYKDYLKERVGPETQRRGVKSKMAQAIFCQPTYISQILNANAHLSLEQAHQLNAFLGHTHEESHFFLLLVQYERAGTPTLRQYFYQQIEQELENRMVLTKRLGIKNELSSEDQSRYYSSWHYAAFHIALTLPALNTTTELSEFFKVPIAKVHQVLEFLTSVNLAHVDDHGHFSVGTNIIRLGNSSPNILRHHTNWRQQAIDSFDRESISDIHYSAVVSLSKKDALKIKDRLLEQLKKDLEIIKASDEEELYSYCFDFFSLRK